MTLRLLAMGGLGRMLAPAAVHLRSRPEAHFLRVHDRGGEGEFRSQSRQAWLQHGAQLVSSVPQLISDGEFDGIVICAGKNGDDQQIFQELIPLLHTINKNRQYFILHMSTVSTEFVKVTHQYCQQYGVQYVNYPLTGGAKGAQLAKMLILASGDEVLFQRLQPMLQLLGVPKYFGPDIIAATAVKLIGHLMVFHGLLGISLAATLHKNVFQLHHLDVTQVEFFDFLNQGAGGTRQWEVTLRQGIEHQQWEAGFLVKHAVVDIIYTAQLLIEKNLPAILILPMLEVALLFAYLLMQYPEQEWATQAIAKLIADTPKEKLEEFIQKNIHAQPLQCLKNCVATLPRYIQASVMLDV